MALGVAFQLADDALDYGGASQALGKNAGDDFREGKVTLPLILAMERSKGVEDAFWERAINQGQRAEADFDHARRLVLETGALAGTLEMAGDYADRAKAALAVLADTQWKTALEDLADFAVSRAA
jgi:octaprenyl-diphosphate synthase